MTLYELLAVPIEATSEVIRHAYKRKAQRVHPDKGGSADEFKAVQDAFRVLCDPAKRREYDRTLLTGTTVNLLTAEAIAAMQARTDEDGCSVCGGERIVRVQVNAFIWTREPCPKCGERK